MHTPTIIRNLTVEQAAEAWDAFVGRELADQGMPNVYRVRPNGRGRWQCEWDDWTELGAWRSRWLGRCVRRAQRARRRAVLEALLERKYIASGIDTSDPGQVTP